MFFEKLIFLVKKSWEKSSISQEQIMVKLRRAYGGCLGIRKRKRAWLAAISLGEPLAGFDPGMSEWGNLSRAIGLSNAEYIGIRGEPREVKHLSTLRKRNQTRFPE